jgi:hypothetical protein
MFCKLDHRTFYIPQPSCPLCGRTWNQHTGITNFWLKEKQNEITGSTVLRAEREDRRG